MFSMSIFLQINESFIYSFIANIFRDRGNTKRENIEKEKQNNDVKWQEIDTVDI